MYGVGGEEKRKERVRNRGKRRRKGRRRRYSSETMSRQKCKAYAGVCVRFA